MNDGLWESTTSQRGKEDMGHERNGLTQKDEESKKRKVKSRTTQFQANTGNESFPPTITPDIKRIFRPFIMQTYGKSTYLRQTITYLWHHDELQTETSGCRVFSSTAHPHSDIYPNYYIRCFMKLSSFRWSIKTQHTLPWWWSCAIDPT